MRTRVPGVYIPDASSSGCARRPKASQADEGKHICVEIIQQVREIPGVAGVHVMAYRQEESVAEIIEEAGLLPRPFQSGTPAGEAAIAGTEGRATRSKIPTLRPQAAREPFGAYHGHPDSIQKRSIRHRPGPAVHHYRRAHQPNRPQVPRPGDGRRQLRARAADALAQMAAGAHMLDINAGIPLADEPAILAQTIRLVQSITDAPLSIDSSIVAALQRGLEVYRGQGAGQFGNRRG